jgi:hypothetical protein
MQMLHQRLSRRSALKLGLGSATLVALAACSDDDEDATLIDEQASAPTSASSTDAAAATATLSQAPATATAAATAGPEVGPNGLYTEVQFDEDDTPHLIPMDSILSGGPEKDGIPSIDAPQFATSESWDQYEFRDEGLVIGVDVDGARRAYPFQVLVWHELVNDTLAGEPILISYCPLCGSGIAFERVVEGRAVEFGVSGLLHNSDLLMYDRESDSLWSQINGTAVVGERVGTRLTFYPSEIMTWADWKRAYPDSEVLTTETGAARDYTRDPYGDYYFDSRLFFPVDDSSDNFDALPLKANVTGIEVEGPSYGAFVDDDVREVGIVNETVGETPVVVFADSQAGDNIVVFEREHDGQMLTFALEDEGLVDDETGTRWSFDGLALAGPLAGAQLVELLSVKSFWFAWVAFHPETSLWAQPS